MLGDKLSFAKSAEQLVNVLALRLGHVAVRAQGAHRLAHHCGQVGHNAHDLMVGTQKALEALKGNAGSNGDDNGILIDGRGKRFDDTIEILRLHSDDDALGTSHGLAVVTSSLAAKLACEPLLRRLAHICDRNVLSGHEAGAHDSLEHRSTHVSATDKCQFLSHISILSIRRCGRCPPDHSVTSHRYL